jgi:FixJ family two-component response regulator
MERVIILDDDEDMGSAFCEFLGSRLDIECQSFTSLSDLQKNQSALSDCLLIFLDINLGPTGANGLEAYRWLRGNGFRRKICFLTAHAHGHPLVLQAAQSGADILEKPMSPDRLCSIVRTAIGESSSCA